jgi:tetratricopeptide (TPR) repeat protein
MMTERRFTKISGVVVACAIVAGCATQQANVPPTPDVFNKQLADADAVSKAGDQDKAIGLYQDLAKSDPTREEPWSRIAQIQFTQQHYGQAIVAAQEALQRDQTDRQAKSVLAVSGLRIATQSLGELRQDSALAGDAKSDAQALAKQLRDTLGEDALFPPEQQVQKPVVKKRHIVRKKPVTTAAASDANTDTDAKPDAAPAPAAPAPAPSPAAQKAAKGGGASDPFSALR